MEETKQESHDQRDHCSPVQASKSPLKIHTLSVTTSPSFAPKMKGTQPETPSSKRPQIPKTTKAQKRSKETGPKAIGRARLAPAERTRKGEADEKSLALAMRAAEPAVVAQEDSQVAWEEVGWCWTWGVEEELLLGWFPFEAGDFLCSEDRNGGWWDDCHDIWHLQHIHEIPTSSNNKHTR